MKFKIMRSRFLVCLALAAGATCAAADLTGNWLAAEPRGDGTFRRSYFNLKEQDGKITGTVRLTQFFYSIVESSGVADKFTIVVSMKDGDTDRRRTFEGAISAASGTASSAGGAVSGDELHIAEKRAAGPGPQIIKTPPMGWNSWNKFAGRIDDPTVRAMADAMVRTA
jgi:alpha-galactosidase